MCLERADLVKKKVVAMGGEVVTKPVGARRTEVVGPVSGRREEEERRRRKEDEAEQINILRRSSVIRHQNRSSSSTPHFAAPITRKDLRLPLWHDADVTFLAPLTIAQIDSSTIRPDFSPDQKAWQATWENIYSSSCPWAPFEPFLNSSWNSGATSTIAGGTEFQAVKVSQGIGANCSVVAGLNVLVTHNARQRGTRALGLQNFVDVRIKPEKGDVRNEEAGGKRYWRVKMFVNGAWRSVSTLDLALFTK
jgi:hypothetical protein